MKFEEALPLLRNGTKFKCGDSIAVYSLCKVSLLDTYLGFGIYNIAYPGTSIFHWGIDSNAILSDEWEIYISDEVDKASKVDDIIRSAIEKTIWCFFMDYTNPFTAENAILPPLSTPISVAVMETLKKFLNVSGC